MWHREGRKMATGQYRSALSFDDVAQKSILAGSAHQNDSERISKPLEEQCDEFVPLVSLRFQGVKTIDVIERNRPPKNSVALEPGDLEVDFIQFFSMFLGWQKGVFALPNRQEQKMSFLLVAVSNGSLLRYIRPANCILCSSCSPPPLLRYIRPANCILCSSCSPPPLLRYIRAANRILWSSCSPPPLLRYNRPANCILRSSCSPPPLRYIRSAQCILCSTTVKIHWVRTMYLVLLWFPPPQPR